MKGEKAIFRFDKNGKIINREGLIKFNEAEKGTVVKFPEEVQFNYHIATEYNKKTRMVDYWGKKKETPYCPLCGRTFE